MSGLQNYGNTCYMNAVVQLLRYTKPVVKRLVDAAPSDDNVRLFMDLLYQGGRVKPFLRVLEEMGFDPRMQHDAHEFMITMLDKLYESVDLPNPFEGTMRTVLRCANGHESKSAQKFVCLSINGGVEDGVVELLEPEVVECKCEECDCTTMTKHTFLEPGDAVCVHFKRFNAERKLRYEVPICTEWNGYKLVGSCNHVGSMHGGHYTATVLTGDGWRAINDEYVTVVDKLPKSSKVPYIMVYVKE